MHSILCLSTLIYTVYACSKRTGIYKPSVDDPVELQAKVYGYRELYVRWKVYNASKGTPSFKITITPPDHPPITTLMHHSYLYDLDPSTMYTIEVKREYITGRVGPGHKISMRIQD
uniref:Fibronectin type-III domain-containing protein n=1 Tax=Schistocephalus solidus TaxID=70667 RepID=A0A0X3NY41_SCHSO